MGGDVKPPFPYFGGKVRLASKIVPLIPPHTVYVEPFCGSAAVFWRKPWPSCTNNNFYREVINDRDGDIVHFYRMLRERPQELIAACCATPFSRAEYEQAKAIEGGDIERARRLFVAQTHCFGGKRNGGWRTTRQSRNHAATYLEHCRRLYECAERLSSAYIECDDAVAVIKRWDSPQTFFYCDPPYPGTSQGHYSGYGEDDFAALVEALSAAKGSFVLSCNDRDDLPTDWQKVVLKDRKGPTRIGAANSEAVWRVVRNHPKPEAVQRIYDSGALDCFTGAA